jgi:hypothetical protein
MKPVRGLYWAGLVCGLANFASSIGMLSSTFSTNSAECVVGFERGAAGVMWIGARHQTLEEQNQGGEGDQVAGNPLAGDAPRRGHGAVWGLHAVNGSTDRKERKNRKNEGT